VVRRPAPLANDGRLPGPSRSVRVGTVANGPPPAARCGSRNGPYRGAHSACQRGRTVTLRRSRITPDTSTPRPTVTILVSGGTLDPSALFPGSGRAVGDRSRT